MSLSLNGMRVTALRITTPWSGAWAGDVDIDLGERLALPTGPATLLIETTPFLCSIDPSKSGRFGQKARARIVAGSGGWEKAVAAKHYHNDGGVLTTAVLATTAAEVQERVVEALPGRFGVDFVRRAGPASSVLAGLTWHVDATGNTIVSPRVPVPATPALEVLLWDARTKVATIATSEVVAPGTILTDSRFGTAMVRDVEQTWGDGGARAIAQTMDVDAAPLVQAGPELVAIIGAIARDAANASFLAAVRYRVVAQLPDGRFNLQAVTKSKGAPDLKSISLAPAVPGMKVTVAPGTILHVIFAEGDRSAPVVVRFEAGPTPIEVSFDAAVVRVGGPSASPVALATAVAQAFTVVAANAGLTSATMAAALAPILPLIGSTKLVAS